MKCSLFNSETAQLRERGEGSTPPSMAHRRSARIAQQASPVHASAEHQPHANTSSLERPTPKYTIRQKALGGGAPSAVRSNLNTPCVGTTTKNVPDARQKRKTILSDPSEQIDIASRHQNSILPLCKWTLFWNTSRVYLRDALYHETELTTSMGDGPCWNGHCTMRTNSQRPFEIVHHLNIVCDH